MTFNSVDLLTQTLNATPENLAAALSSGRIVTYTGEGELQRLVDEAMMRRSRNAVLAITLAPRPQPAR